MQRDNVEKKASRMFGFLAIVLIIVGLTIALTFRNLPYGEQLEIKDYFNFVGSFTGASISALISIVVLFITVSQTREIQEENRAQYQIANINEKLKDLRNKFEIHNNNEKILYSIECRTLLNIKVDELEEIENLEIIGVIESAIRVILEFQGKMMKELGAIGKEQILKYDMKMIELSNELCRICRYIVEAIEDPEDNRNLLEILLNEYVINYEALCEIRLTQISEIQDDIITQSKRKYSLLEIE